jgi:hypothetical protein
MLYSTKQSSSLKGKHTWPELTVVCAISAQWQKATACLPSHPVSSQFLGTVTKGGNNCIKIRSHKVENLNTEKPP